MSVRESLRRIEAWAGRNGASLGLRPPVDEAQLAAAEAALGEPLPADYVELLRVADGQGEQGTMPWLLGCDRLASLERVLAQLVEERGLAEEYPPPDSFDLDDHVRAGRFHARRLPIAGSPWWDGDTTYLDLEPGPAGTKGQVVTLVTECDFAVMGEGLGAALARWADALEQGRFAWDAEAAQVVPAGGEAFDDHPALALCTKS